MAGDDAEGADEADDAESEAVDGGCSLANAACMIADGARALVVVVVVVVPAVLAPPAPAPAPAAAGVRAVNCCEKSIK